jgi:hypothetical protein
MNGEPPVPGEVGATEAAALAREFIWERLEVVRRLAVIGQDFAAIGDDLGLKYALLQTVANVESAAATFADLPPKREAA